MIIEPPEGTETLKELYIWVNSIRVAHSVDIEPEIALERWMLVEVSLSEEIITLIIGDNSERNSIRRSTPIVSFEKLNDFTFQAITESGRRYFLKRFGDVNCDKLEEYNGYQKHREYRNIIEWFKSLSRDNDAKCVSYKNLRLEDK